METAILSLSYVARAKNRIELFAVCETALLPPFSAPLDPLRLTIILILDPVVNSIGIALSVEIWLRYRFQDSIAGSLGALSRCLAVRVGW